MIRNGMDHVRAGDDGRSIAAFTDLLFGARIRAAAASQGITTVISTLPDRISEAVRAGARTVFVDLDVRGADPAALIAALKAGAGPVFVLAFGSHVRTEAILAAREAGADQVLARGAFARQLPAIIRTGSAPGG